VIEGLKPYPAYKPSAMPWLGRIPEHWNEKRAKYLFREVDERSKTGEEELLSVSHITGVTPRSQKNVTMFMAESTVGYKLCRPGDVVINTMWAWMGALGVSPMTGLVSPAYGVYRPSHDTPLTPAFAGHILRSPQYVNEYICRSTGIQSSRLRLYPEQFLRIPVACPPGEEQGLMLRFLAYVDRRIRRHVAAKKKLIALLNEQKQAIIHRAVTRGLDPNVRLKHSGVEWLGEVPEHWSVSSLRLRYDQCLGKMVDAKRATGTHLVPYLRNVDVRWDKINTDDLPLIDIAPHERDRFTLRQGDLLVCEGRHLGRCAFWNGQVEVCAFQKALHRLRPLKSDRDRPRFMFYCLRLANMKNAFDVNIADNTIPHLTGEKLRAHRFAFPPMAEQEAIATYLDATLGTIDKADSAARAEIDLLREYRTRLISDVVTGKLDVREAAARLPDEPDEPEPIDDDTAEEEAEADSDAASEDEA
jgi:type I restriction enzyme, S subunit